MRKDWKEFLADVGLIAMHTLFGAMAMAAFDRDRYVVCFLILVLAVAAALLKHDRQHARHQSRNPRTVHA